MKLDFGLQLSQRQGITLTAQVQQAIKLLHMTNLEIGEYVAEQFMENPFIESATFSEKNLEKLTKKSSDADVDLKMADKPYANDAGSTKLSNENQFETGESYIPRSTVSKAIPDFDLTTLVVSEKASLYAHVNEFIKTLRLPAFEELIAVKLMEALEPTGWIGEDWKQIASTLQCEGEKVEHVLSKLQEIEPAGLFARSLKECLKLQAQSRDCQSEKLDLLLENLHLMGSGKFDLLKRRCGFSDGEMVELFKIIKSFDPKPGLQFETSDTPIREPDLKVSKTDAGWIVELNNSTLPSVVVSKDLSNKFKSRVQSSDEKNFIQEKLNEARWLTSAIAKRNETMLKVGTAIIERQKGFLERGAEHIEPMVLNDIAEAVGMHESTISRVTTGSLIQTPRGTLELKAFFSVGIKQEGERESASASSIRHHVKKLICNEEPDSPLSDDLIVEMLNEKGIQVARRTVAKYRKMEKIPSSFARKRRNVLSGVA